MVVVMCREYRLEKESADQLRYVRECESINRWLKHKKQGRRSIGKNINRGMSKCFCYTKYGSLQALGVYIRRDAVFCPYPPMMSKWMELGMESIEYPYGHHSGINIDTLNLGE